MAGESLSCAAARKKSKNKSSSNYSLSSENGGHHQHPANGNGKVELPPVRTTRGGLRVYKVVILGDGGVGKSGEYSIGITNCALIRKCT